MGRDIFLGMGWFGKKKKVATGPVGGGAFFLSLVALLIVTGSNAWALIQAISINSLENFLWLMAGIVTGLLLSRLFKMGKMVVLLHEYRHAIVSGLVGNRARSLRVERSGEGQFEYEYTRATAPYNAFIALAPYWFPMFTILAAFLVIALSRQHLFYTVALMGIGYALDLTLNLSEISSHQTDISNIRGGANVGVLYIFAMNGCIATFILAWALHGNEGFRILLSSLWQLVSELVHRFQHVS